MKAPFRWVLPAIAITATIEAVLAGTNDAIAIPAAVFAVAVAGFVLWDSVRDRLEDSLPSGPSHEAVPIGGSDVWFQEGPMSQESIVLLLDRVDRALAHPALPIRPSVEMERLGRLPWESFLDYVESRLLEIEAGS